MDNIIIAAIFAAPLALYHIAFKLDKIFNKIDEINMF